MRDLSSLFSRVKAPSDLSVGAEERGVVGARSQAELGGLSHNVFHAPSVGYGRAAQMTFILKKGNETNVGAETGIDNVKSYLLGQRGQIKKRGDDNRSDRRFEKGQVSRSIL